MRSGLALSLDAQHLNANINAQLAFTKSILGHHQISPERNGSVGVGVLKRKLRPHIPLMSEAFQARIEKAVTLEMEPSGLSQSGQSVVHV